MNRVRVVAVAAVALGVAVVVGTNLQAPGSFSELTQFGASPPARDQHILSAPDLSLARGIVPSNTARPAATATADMTHSAASVPSAAPMEDERSVQVVSASILSAIDLVAANEEATEEAEVSAETLILRPDQSGEEAAETTPAPAEMLEEPEQTASAACAIWVVVIPAEAAMLDTSVYAPCDRGAEVQISHAGLSFDTLIGDDGQLLLAIPALVDDATITVTLDDGRSQSDTTYVSDLAEHARVALQWAGPAELALHAYEFGAEYGQDGHIWAENPKTPGGREHGFLTSLGHAAIDGGRLMQVYSYPSGPSSRSGEVALEIEVPITAASCGAPLEAVSVELNAAVAVQQQDIRIEMPGCDDTGGYLVLPGVLPALQIAALR